MARVRRIGLKADHIPQLGDNFGSLESLTAARIREQ
jgi:hypothetical protein